MKKKIASTFKANENRTLRIFKKKSNVNADDVAESY